MQIERAQNVLRHLAALVFVIAERFECWVDRRVGDLEVAAAGELLELDEREVWLNAGGITVHQQTDRAGGRDDGCLGVAIAELFAEFECLIPSGGCVMEQIHRVAQWNFVIADEFVVDGDG